MLHMLRLLRRYCRSELAQSVTEFALAFPFLTWVLLGTVDFARVYHLQVAVTNAARTGGQFALDSRRTQSDVRNIIVQEAAPLVSIDPVNDITLTATPSWAPGNRLDLVVQRPFTAFTPFISTIWGGGALSIRGTNTVRFNP